MHLSVARCLALSAVLMLSGPLGQRAHAQSTEVRIVTLRVAADESYRAGAKGLDFNDVRSRTELGLVLFRLGRDDEALAELKIALAIYPDTPRARAGRCGLLARRRSVDEGLAECTEAIRLAPDQARLFIIRGDLYRQKGEPEQMKDDHAGAEADHSAARTKLPRDVY